MRRFQPDRARFLWPLILLTRGVYASSFTKWRWKSFEARINGFIKTISGIHVADPLSSRYSRGPA